MRLFVQQGVVKPKQLITCSYLALSVSLWQQLRRWIGFVGVDTNNVTHHLVQFTHMTCGGKVKRSLDFVMSLGYLIRLNLCPQRGYRLKNPFLSMIHRGGGLALWLVQVLVNHFVRFQFFVLLDLTLVVLFVWCSRHTFCLGATICIGI